LMEGELCRKLDPPLLLRLSKGTGAEMLIKEM